MSRLIIFNFAAKRKPLKCCIEDIHASSDTLLFPGFRKVFRFLISIMGIISIIGIKGIIGIIGPIGLIGRINM